MKKARSKRPHNSVPAPENTLLYRFDYERYTELRPFLRAATLPAHFEKYCTNPELEEALFALEDGQISPEMLRQEIVRAECCRNMPLELDAAFPRLVRELAQRPKSSDAALVLSELLAGRRNIDPWLRADAALLGILTPDDARSVFFCLHALSARGSLGSRTGRKRRRGGLFGHVGSFLRGLFASSPSDEELLFLLHDLFRDAMSNEEGLALLTRE